MRRRRFGWKSGSHNVKEWVLPSNGRKSGETETYRQTLHRDRITPLPSLHLTPISIIQRKILPHIRRRAALARIIQCPPLTRTPAVHTRQKYVRASRIEIDGEALRGRADGEVAGPHDLGLVGEGYGACGTAGEAEGGEGGGDGGGEGVDGAGVGFEDGEACVDLAVYLRSKEIKCE